MIDDNFKGRGFFFNKVINKTRCGLKLFFHFLFLKLILILFLHSLINKIKIGCRAEVVFGKNKKYAGIIKSLSKKKPAYETKDILNIIDDEPIVYPQQLRLWKWISEYYMCSEGEVMAAALPTHLN